MQLHDIVRSVAQQRIQRVGEPTLNIHISTSRWVTLLHTLSAPLKGCMATAHYPGRHDDKNKKKKQNTTVSECFYSDGVFEVPKRFNLSKNVRVFLFLTRPLSSLELGHVCVGRSK
jgi:hypothetical protein